MKKEDKYWTYKDGSRYRIPKIGEKFRVTRKCEGQKNGWRSGWAPAMDRTVGMVGRVKSISKFRLDIELRFSNTCAWNYPMFILAPDKNGLERLVERYEERQNEKSN